MPRVLREGRGLAYQTEPFGQRFAEDTKGVSLGRWNVLAEALA